MNIELEEFEIKMIAHALDDVAQVERDLELLTDEGRRHCASHRPTHDDFKNLIGKLLPKEYRKRRWGEQ